MYWCSIYLTPQGLPKYIYLSPPLIFPTTYNGIRTKNCPVWMTPGAAPIRWMGPIRNPRWGKGDTVSWWVLLKSSHSLPTTKSPKHIQLVRYDNVTLSPLLPPARVANRSHSTYGSNRKQYHLLFRWTTANSIRFKIWHVLLKKQF
jgi:hypothetical protein